MTHTDLKKCSGKVYIVGAGPGDCSLMTVRSQQILAQAEVLIYDALVDLPQLNLIPANCLKIEVGKRGGKPSVQQQEINCLLIEHCTTGRQVVRLKSGDPFIFGRVASEIQTLIEAGCEFEVIPGISSALAAPLLAGIPLTDPVMSRCFAVMSAHEPDALDWEALVQLETLVILMGGRNLEEIIHQLQRHGRPTHTPIAIIRECGRPPQKIWTGTLATIGQKTAGESLAPCIMIIGEVVRMREYLTPKKSETAVKHSPDPLSGKTILVTRAAGQSSQFCERLQQLGANVIEMPALVIGPPSQWQPLDEAIAQLSDFNWLILTSTNGVDAFFDRLQFQGKDARSLAGLKIAVVGKKTAESLRSRCLVPDFIPPDFVADSLVAHFPDPLNPCKILFPRVETGGREVLVKDLTAKGATVIEVPAYQSCCPDHIPADALAALRQGDIDAITFASSKTVQNFCHLIREVAQLPFPGPGLDRVRIASIGPETSKTCQTLWGRVDIEAREYTLEGLTDALIAWANQSHN